MDNGQVINAFIVGKTEARANYLYIADKEETTELISFGMCIAERSKASGEIKITEGLPGRNDAMRLQRETNGTRLSVQRRLIRMMRESKDDYFCPNCGKPATDREYCSTCEECECMCQCDED